MVRNRRERRRSPRRLPGAARAASGQRSTGVAVQVPPGTEKAGRTVPVAVLLVLVVLALVADDRHAGLVADGRQMIRTAVALAETGEIGQARGRDFTLERAGGDAVSRFGMGMSLLQVPAATLAPGVEARRGAGSSQALFLIVPWLAVGVAAAAAGAIARRLGGTRVEIVGAVLLASVASPLGSYAFLEFSEPVQAAALAGALALALASAQSPRPRRGLDLAAGAAAGLAVLTKSSLILCVPAVLLPLVDVRSPRTSLRSLARAAAGAAAPMTVWLVFEFQRFGRVFGGYPDDRFTHPWADGFWRLLVGPNRGLLLFWPALLLFLWAGRRWGRGWLGAAEGRAWVGAGLVLGAQVTVAAGYWGWHGMEGWGPRLILAAVPVLAPFAATALQPGRRAVLVAVVLLSLTLNLPPVLQHPTPVATYVTNLRWPEIPASDVPRYPFYATARTQAGVPTVVPFAVVDTVPAANPWQLYLWFWRATHLSGDALLERLLAPPWRHERPDLVPPEGWRVETAREVAPPPQLGFLGRSLTGTGGPYASVYLEALLDQVVRANQQGRIDRALALSEKRLALRADGEAAAWRLETLRRAGRAQEAEQLLRSLPESARREPLINVVLALFDRDFGEERRARALLSSVAASFAGTPVQPALAASLDAWPATLDAMVRVARRDATVEHRP